MSAPRVKTIPAKDHDKHDLSRFPNFSKTGSVTGMRKLYYGQGSLLVRCGAYIYNVTSEPKVYEAAH